MSPAFFNIVKKLKDAVIQTLVCGLLGSFNKKKTVKNN